MAFFNGKHLNTSYNTYNAVESVAVGGYCSDIIAHLLWWAI